MMRMLRKFGLLFALCAATVAPAFAQTTTTIYDENTLPNDLLFRSDDYNGGFQATYVNSGCGRGAHGCDISTGAGIGWSLNLYNQNVRKVWVTLSRPVGSSPMSPVPDGLYSANVEIYSQCWDSNDQQITFSSMTPGTSQNRCRFGLDFSNSSGKYKLVMGPYIPSLAVNTTGTGWASVSCHSASAGACNSWTIAPYTIAGNGNVPTVANLYLFAKKGLVLIGQYYNTYRIDATNP